MKGTKDLRQAAMIALDKIKEQVAQKDDTTDRIANQLHENKEAKAANKEEPHKVPEYWIYLSWLIDLELLKKSAAELEKWIIDGDYPI